MEIIERLNVRLYYNCKYEKKTRFSLKTHRYSFKEPSSYQFMLIDAIWRWMK